MRLVTLYSWCWQTREFPYSTCQSLRESVLFFLLKEAHFIPPRYGLAARCASRGPYGAARHLTPSQAAPKVSAKRLHTDQPDRTIVDNSKRPHRSTGQNMHYQEAPKSHLAKFDSPPSPPLQPPGKPVPRRLCF